MVYMDDLSSYSDEKLQIMAASGDRKAMEILSERYSRLVRVCARPYFLVGGDSEDLTQEGMLGLLSAIHEFDSSREASFQTYAEVCIRRRILSAIKSANRKKHFPLNDGVSLEEAFSDELSGSGTHSVLDFHRTPEEQVLARESVNEFFETFSQQLSSFEQKILGMYLDGYSYREMAVLCSREQKAIDNAVQRIRRKLARTPNFGDFSEN